MADPVDVYSLVDEGDQERLSAAIEDAYRSEAKVARQSRTPAAIAAAEDQDDAGGMEPGEVLKLTPFDELIGIEPSVYRQIEAAINSGKQHLMFYGPPGTGKTTLARLLAGVLNGRNWTLITGSADWSSQDIIGGYQPVESGAVKFFPGVLLRDFDRPLVIDELNRCDIDKVIGPLFTVLSGQATTLPYRVDAADAESAQYVILPVGKAEPAAHEYAPGPAWRLIATINSIDKASLYQMSYALSRRFGWIYVDAPHDTDGFVRSYGERFMDREPGAATGTPPLAAIWSAVNAVRPLGPAPIVEAMRAVDYFSPGADLFGPPTGDLQAAYLDAFELFLLPLLDGIMRHEAEQIVAGVIDAIGLVVDTSEAARLAARIGAMAV